MLSGALRYGHKIFDLENQPPKECVVLCTSVGHVLKGPGIEEMGLMLTAFSFPM